jgi:hypothetical protein
MLLLLNIPIPHSITRIRYHIFKIIEILVNTVALSTQIPINKRLKLFKQSFCRKIYSSDLMEIK